MGKFADPNLDHEGVREKVDRMFQVGKWGEDHWITVWEKRVGNIQWEERDQPKNRFQSSNDSEIRVWLAIRLQINLDS
jgi:hypothetical protein